MSEFETPALGRQYCPGCEPEADPSREILDVRYCSDHTPAVAGNADSAARTSGEWLTGTMEAEGAACRSVQAIIRVAALMALLLGAVACATKPPVYICVPAELNNGTMAIACAPVAAK